MSCREGSVCNRLIDITISLRAYGKSTLIDDGQK